MALPNPCCCCKIIAIVIANSNSQKDDNFNIKLNGTTLGTIDNNKFSCSGRFFVTKTDDPQWHLNVGVLTGPNCTNLQYPGFNPAGRAFCDSGICDFEPLVGFHPSTLSPIVGGESTNLLEIFVTQNNSNGNFGVVKVLGLNDLSGSFSVCQVYYQRSYSFGSQGPGPLPADTHTFKIPATSL